MEFIAEVKEAVIEHVKDMDEGKAAYDLKYFGGCIRFYAKQSASIVGAHALVIVKARMYSPGKVSISVEIPKA